MSTYACHPVSASSPSILSAAASNPTSLLFHTRGLNRAVLDEQGWNQNKVDSKPRCSAKLISSDREISSPWAMPEFNDALLQRDNLVADSDIYLAALMPKKEIGADRFLEDHPEFDGRGVVIAIFDSGVDPAAAGLQVTTDGKHKIIDIIDCTGSGDIDTSKVVKADEDGNIVGASGTCLQVNKEWKNPTGEWRVGYKFVHELFPGSLTSRLKKERKKKWDEEQRELVSNALRELSLFDMENPKPTESSLKRHREDLQNRVNILQKLNESYDDNGPLIDAVVWHDGEVWRAALDTQDMEDRKEAGKLADFVPLTNFRTEHKYGVFTNMDACSFAVNVYNNGEVLSIVTDCSPHGTHVAGITAAYHPEELLLNGVAPGAQIISCKIGDSRLGSMETGTGLTRALIAVIENKCDMINMSYGEPTMAPDYGRVIDLIDQVVNKYGVIFVSSAGNEGPSLSTVGAPGGTSSSVLGIGAYVSPSMATAAHSLVEPPSEGLQYTWSSRGPAADGDVGVCLSAPGGAVAPVPKWTLQRRMLMNGTSMASPCACGGIALVLSSLKAEGRSVNPYIVRKALENTALCIDKCPEDALTTGRGLLQVDKAYEYLQKAKDKPPVWYSVQLSRNGNGEPSIRGVYLRDLHECQQTSEWFVKVQPKFQEDTNKLDILIPFEERIRIETTNKSWVKCPEYLLLTTNGRTFNIVVDPTGLKPGLHFAEVIGIDCNHPWRGPLFRIPITVTKPVEVINRPPLALFSDIQFVPGHIERIFLAVPHGATWVEATLKLTGFDTPRKFFVNAVQLSPMTRPHVWGKVLTVTSPSTKSFSFGVKAGLTMEITIAQFWSSGSGSERSASAGIEILFHGLMGKKEVFLNGGNLATRVDVSAPLSSETLCPEATFTKIRIPYRPSESKLEPLSAERDKLPNGRQIYGLTLSYKLSLSEASNITPRFPLLNNRIYDSEFESQFYMIIDTNKQVLSMGDAYPKKVKLPKGDYTVRLLIRHENISYLEKLKKSVLFIDRVLGEKNTIKLSCYATLDGSVTGNNAFKSTTLAAGETRPVYICSPSDDKLPKDASIGSLLLGRLTYAKVSVDKNAKGYPLHSSISLVIPPQPKNDEAPKDNTTENKRSPFEKLADEVRDAKLKILSILPKSSNEEWKEWFKHAKLLRDEFPTHLPLMVDIMQKVSKDPEKYDEVIEVANAIIAIVNKDNLAKFFSMKSEPEDADTTIRKDMEMQRDALADALYQKGLALAEQEDRKRTETKSVTENESVNEESVKPVEEDVSCRIQDKAHHHNGSNDQFDENYAELRKWVDISSSKYSLLTVKRERRHGRHGTALKVLNDLIQDDPKTKSLYELRRSILEDLKWTNWVEYEKKYLIARFPTGYRLF